MDARFELLLWVVFLIAGIWSAASPAYGSPLPVPQSNSNDAPGAIEGTPGTQPTSLSGAIPTEAIPQVEIASADAVPVVAVPGTEAGPTDAAVQVEVSSVEAVPAETGAVEATQADVLPAEYATVEASPAEATQTSSALVETTLSDSYPAGAMAPAGEMAPAEATEVPFSPGGDANSDTDTLIDQALMTVESLKQQLATISAMWHVKTRSIQSVYVDNGAAATQVDGEIHNVTIGDGFMRYTPATIKAKPGDTIMFTWVGENNHSVTESDALGSCTKSTSQNAFDSDIQPPGTVWNLSIPAEARGLKFFYCKVATHCAEKGMAGVIITPV